MIRTIIDGFIACVIVIALTLSWIMYTEAYPYSSVRVSVRVEVPSTGPVPIYIDLFRTDLCPYYLERRIYSGEARKVLDEIVEFGTPDKLGREKFTAPTSTDEPLMPNAYGLYEARIGSRCNIIQWFFPNWGPWYRAQFRTGD